VSRAKKFYMLA